MTVTKAENVGPYATVQLHSTDASALDTWLAQNGFQVPAEGDVGGGEADSTASGVAVSDLAADGPGAAQVGG